MTIEELTALCEERGRAIYEANCHILQLTDSLNAATRERDKMAKRLRETAQILVNEFGTVGPSDAEEMAKHAVQEINRSTEREHLLEIERDEARAEVEMLRERVVEHQRKFEAGWAVLCKERDEARAEVERLIDERDELLVRVANQDAELRATRDAHGTAYRRGAEAMREAIASHVRGPANELIRAWRIPEER